MSLDELRTLTREYRLLRNLSIRAFARVTKISQSSLSRFERGERGLRRDALKRLCDYLGERYDEAMLRMMATCPNCKHVFLARQVER